MLAIFAPYDRTETCLAAIRVADLALAAGQSVRLITTGPCHKGIHPYWDGQVRTTRFGGLFEYGQGLTHAVWFHCGANYLDTVSHLGDKVKQIYVPSYHDMHLYEWAAAARADSVVYPSASAKKVGAEVLPVVLAGEDPPAENWCRWESGFRPRERRPKARLNSPRVLIYCDTHAVDDCAPLVCRIAVGLTREVSGAEVHLMAAKTWSKRDRRLVRDVARESGGRIGVSHQLGVSDLLAKLNAADWLALPGVRSNFGLLVGYAASFGVPVVCYDVDPLAELVVDGHNGLLVPCELHGSRVGAPSAVPSGVAFAGRLVDSVTDVRLYNRMRSGDWRLAEWARAFQEFWYDQLDLVP